MMQSISVTAALTLILLVSGCGTPPEEIAVSPFDALRVQLETPDDGVMVIAHRSCWRLAMENSVRGVEACIRHNVDMVEIDVRRTKDGHLVLMHDDTVDRTTNGTGPVEDMTLAEAKALRLRENGGGPDAALTDEQIPLLEEVLLAAKGKILINLDIKADLYDQAFDLLEQTGTAQQILIKMVALPDDENLRSAKFLGKTYFMPIVRQCRDEKEGICSPDLSDVLPGYFDLNPVAYEIVFQDEGYLLDGVETIRSSSARLWVNTLQAHHAAGHLDDDAALDPDAHWGHLISLGANMIQTDRPAELTEYLEAKGLR